MKKRTLRRRMARGGLVMALVAMPFISGCVTMASQDQLNALEEARKAADAAEADLDACKRKQAELRNTLSAKKQLLTNKKADLQAVQQGLGQ